MIKRNSQMIAIPGAAAQGEGAGLALRQDRGRADARQQAQPADQGAAEQATILLIPFF